MLLPDLKICSWFILGKKLWVIHSIVCVWDMDFEPPVVCRNCTIVATLTPQLPYFSRTLQSSCMSYIRKVYRVEGMNIVYYFAWLLPEAWVSQWLTELLQWFSFVAVHVGAQSWQENNTWALSLHPSVRQLWKVWSWSILNRGLVPPVT